MKLLLLIFLIPIVTAQPYSDFIEQHKEHAKPTTLENIQEQIDYALYRLEKDGQEYAFDLNTLTPAPFTTNWTKEEAQTAITTALNIKFLLPHLAEKLNTTIIAEAQREGYTEQEIIINTPHVGPLKILILKPHTKNPPAIIGLHGHEGTPEKFAQQFHTENLARAGFLVAIPEFKAMGCNQEEHNTSIELLTKGFTLMGIHVYETLLTEHYLNQQGITNIGALAHSGGSSILHLTLWLNTTIRTAVHDYPPNYLNYCAGIHDETIPQLKRHTPAISNPAHVRIKEYPYSYPKLTPEQLINEFKHMKETPMQKLKKIILKVFNTAIQALIIFSQ